MKLSQILLIAAVSSASAFTVVRPAGVSMTTALQATKAAKDHEEDLALTREVIAKFMGDDEKEEEKKEEKEPAAKDAKDE